MSKLGKQGTDKITGFVGIIVGECQYLTGCNQFCLQPAAKDGDYKSSQWFDEARVEITGLGVCAEDVTGEKNGGPNRDCPR